MSPPRIASLPLKATLTTILAVLGVCATQVATAQASHRPCHKVPCSAPGDTTPPTVGWTTPAAGATVSGVLWEAANSGPSGRCEVSASDSVGVSKIVFYVDGTALNTETIAPYNCKFDSTTVTDGSHTLKAVAYDAAGNNTTTLRTINVDNVPEPQPEPEPEPQPEPQPQPGDSTPPTVTWTTPAEGATVSGTMFEAANSGPSGRCEIGAADNVGVSKVIFYVDGAVLNQEHTAPWNCNFDTTAVADGNHTLKAVAYDAAGNTASAQRVVNVQNTRAPLPAPSPSAPFGDAAGLKSWVLDFQDEFDGTSLNTDKWDATWLTGESGYSPPMNEYMNNCFHSGQATVANGALRLGSVPNSNTSCRKKDGSVAPYVTGAVTSHRRSSDPSTKGYTTAYGYFEARMNLPVRNGGIVNFPAWWTNGAGLNWPSLGEIDIMEELGKGTPCWHYHYQDGSGAHRGPGGCISTIDGQTVDWSGWHTYAARWEPGKITFYYDGRQVASWTADVISAQHFLILNYSMDGTAYTNTAMEVDYVRVWK